MKKNLLYGLGLGLTLFGLTQTAQAAVGDNFQDGGIWYTVLDETAKTVETQQGQGTNDGPNASLTGKVVIPSTVSYGGDDYTVTGIGNRSFYWGYLSNIDLPETLTYIGQSAFYFTDLTEVTLPASITSLGTYCFSSNQSLETVYYKTSASIPEGAFIQCPIKDFYCYATVPPSIYDGNDVFSSSYTTDATLYVPEASISDYQSTWSKYFSTIEALPAEGEVKPLPTGSNFSYDGIKYTVLDSEALTVETYAGDGMYDFANSVLTGDVYIPEKVLDKNDIEYTVVAIGDFSFYHGTNITSVDLPETLLTIGESAFYNTAIETIIIPASVTSMDASAFASNSKLTEVILIADLATIPVAAFQNSPITDFYITSTTPPAIPNSNAFEGIGENAILYVEDADAVAAYQASDWANYFTIQSLYGEEDSTVVVTINVDGVEAGTDMSTYFTATYEETITGKTGDLDFTSASYTGAFTPPLALTFEPTADYTLEVAFAESLTSDEAKVVAPNEGGSVWGVTILGDAPDAVTINVTVKPSTVGVNGLNSENGAAAIYNLQGVKVAEKDAHNGIFIINGKKVVLK